MNKFFVYIFIAISFSCNQVQKSDTPSVDDVFHFYLEEAFPTFNEMLPNEEYHIFLIPKYGCSYCEQNSLRIFDTTQAENVLVFTNLNENELTIIRRKGLFLEHDKKPLLPDLNFGKSYGTIYLRYKNSIQSLVKVTPNNLDSLAHIISK